MQNALSWFFRDSVGSVLPRSSDEPHSPREPAPTSTEQAPELPKIIKFDELARCGEEIWIEHERQIYRLRRTRQGKLILTK